MHRNRISEAVIRNKESVKYAFQAKESHLVVFFDREKTSLKDGIVDAMNHLGIPTINNDSLGTISFKLTSFEEAEGLKGIIQNIMDSFEYDTLSNPIFPNEKNWLLNENSVLETFIGSAVFDGQLPDNNTLMKKRLDLIEQSISYERFGFNELRNYFTEVFINFKENEFIESIVKETMEHTEFFKDEEHARSFVEQTFDALSETEYRQMGFLKFRLNLLCEQIQKRLDSKEGDKIIYEGTFRKALQNTGHVHSEKMFELPSKSEVTQSLPVRLFSTENIEQTVFKEMFNKKENESSLSEYFENSLSFEKTYFEIIKGHLKHIQNPKPDSIQINSIVYVNALYKIMDSYFTMKAGFSLFNQIIRQSKTVTEKSFKEFVDSFELK